MTPLNEFEAMEHEEQVILTTEQALSILPDGDMIHTYRSASVGLIGADWSRESLEEAIRNNVCEIGGDQCRKINHGLVVWVSDDDPVFVECRQDIDYNYFSNPTQS